MSKKRAQPKPKTQKTMKKQKVEVQEQQVEEQEESGEQKFSLYKLLQLESGTKSTIDEIKRQYRKLVMICHPDKNQHDQNSKQKFLKLQQAYEILSDPEKKKLYDETGTIGDNFDEKAFQTAYQYYRTIYKKIDKQDIQDFEKKYRLSDMQKEDLIQFYNNHKGDMTTLLECIPLSRNKDVPRFILFYIQSIKSKKLPKYKLFDETQDHVRELPDETEQFNKQQAQRQKSMKQLTLAIKSKSNASFLDSLQQKYAPKKQKANQKTEEKVTKVKKTKQTKKQ